MHVISISRTSTAKPEALWELWANVPGRTRWDDSLESISLEGEFRTGSFGTVTLKGQPSRKFEIIECVPLHKYTDRFFLPMNGKMDWVHTIEKTEGGIDVTFDVSVSGPTAFILRFIMKKILAKDLPGTVDKLIAVAEKNNA